MRNMIVSIRVEGYEFPEDLTTEDVSESIRCRVPMMMRDHLECDDFTHTVVFDGDDIIVSIKGKAIKESQ